jgi:hypothetical protein
VPKKTKKAESASAVDPNASSEMKHGKTSARRRSTTTKKKKTAGSATARAAKAAQRHGSPTGIAPTDDEIRLRAYFISERRHRLALTGDASSDWLEAKRQLLSELCPR